MWTDAPLIVALEDDYGRGAAVGAVAPLGDGRLEVDGWRTDDWDSAIADVERLAITRPIRELYVGASLLDRMPQDGPLPRARPVGMTEARAGLAVFRDLAAAGQLVHDDTAELDQADCADAGAGITVGSCDRPGAIASGEGGGLGGRRRRIDRPGSRLSVSYVRLHNVPVDTYTGRLR